MDWSHSGSLRVSIWQKSTHSESKSNLHERTASLSGIEKPPCHILHCSLSFSSLSLFLSLTYCWKNPLLHWFVCPYRYRVKPVFFGGGWGRIGSDIFFFFCWKISWHPVWTSSCPSFWEQILHCRLWNRGTETHRRFLCGGGECVAKQKQTHLDTKAVARDICYRKLNRRTDHIGFRADTLPVHPPQEPFRISQILAISHTVLRPDSMLPTLVEFPRVCYLLD